MVQEKESIERYEHECRAVEKLKMGGLI
jgi:hypothetical protein